MLLPMLTGEERRLLEESIIREGCRDPIVFWRETGILIDGHNRYDICTRLQIPYREVSLSFKNRSDVIDWIYKNQMSRRNITDAQRTYIIGKLYRERKRERGNSNSPLGEGKSGTAGVIAREYDTGKATVERAEKFANAVDILKDNIGEDFSRQILDEKIALPKVDVQRLAEKPVEIQAALIKKLYIVVGKKLDTLVSQRIQGIYFSSDSVSQKWYAYHF
ncbi:MAG: hypothetical protein QME27_01075 [Syntrophaceae bacterium]|nr:hypothetical protein [Syntrophaceae bacterium]